MVIILINNHLHLQHGIFLGALQLLTHLIFTTILSDKYYFHFIGEEIEVHSSK